MFDFRFAPTVEIVDVFDFPKVDLIKRRDGSFDFPLEKKH